MGPPRSALVGLGSCQLRVKMTVAALGWATIMLP